MKNQLLELAKYVNADHYLSIYIAGVLVFIFITAVAIHLVFNKYVFNLAARHEEKKRTFLSLLVNERLLYSRLVFLIQGLVIYYQTKVWVGEGLVYDVISTFALGYTLFFALLLSYALLDIAFRVLYRSTKLEFFAINTVIQTIKLIFGLVFIIYLVSMLANKSPLAILSGLGAMSAVLMLVFKDLILGFSAGLQLSTNKMVQIGDWIEMPKYGADGDVIEVGLNVVKVRNFDKTITTIPTYSLVSDSFKNWRGMFESGGRRIKRALILDPNSVRFLTTEDITRLKKAKLLAPYLESKQTEIQEYNQSFDLSTKINGRRLTNLGTLRAYLQTYLRNHPGVNQDLTLLVRQLAPSHFGLPLEIYCFTATTVWAEYEAIQSDIFDHIYAILDEFDVRTYLVSGVGVE